MRDIGCHGEADGYGFDESVPEGSFGECVVDGGHHGVDHAVERYRGAVRDRLLVLVVAQPGTDNRQLVVELMAVLR